MEASLLQLFPSGNDHYRYGQHWIWEGTISRETFTVQRKLLREKTFANLRDVQDCHQKLSSAFDLV